MAATAASEVNDGPVLNLINKRLRALRKKYNRILQMEESLAQGKSLNKEQEETLRSKASVVSGIDELEKLRQPLAAAVADEISLAIQRHQVSASESPVAATPSEASVKEESEENLVSESEKKTETLWSVEDLLNLLYFGSIFDVKTQVDFTATILTRTHERGCCLTYDYVTDDDAADLLGERDLDMISMLGGLLISRPVDSSLSHKNALQRCLEHAKLWLTKSEQPIEPDSSVTYAELRSKLNKIMASDYFTRVPEMKAPVEVAAAAGNYASYQVPVHASVVPINVPVQLEDSHLHYELKEEQTDDNAHGHETNDEDSSPHEVFQVESGAEDLSGLQVETEPVRTDTDMGRDPESKDQSNAPRRSYLNYRGSRGGSGGARRGYSNGRGGRGNSRGGGYQNGRSQYYDTGNYYARNYYNNRGRGGRGSGSGYTQQFTAGQAGQVAAE